MSVAHSLDGLLEDADVVYTDCWPSELSGDVQERFHDLQITAESLDRTPPTARFLPCPPVTRGAEVSADGMTHPRCHVVEAKRWLLHAQNALLVRGLTGQ